MGLDQGVAQQTWSLQHVNSKKSVKNRTSVLFRNKTVSHTWKCYVDNEKLRILTNQCSEIIFIILGGLETPELNATIIIFIIDLIWLIEYSNKLPLLISRLKVTTNQGPIIGFTFGMVVRNTQLCLLSFRTELIGLMICLVYGFYKIFVILSFIIIAWSSTVSKTKVKRLTEEIKEVWNSWSTWWRFLKKL